MVYGMACRAPNGIWLWPGRQSMGLGKVYSMTWRAWHGIWYGLAGIAWCTVCPDGPRMVYSTAWRGSHGIMVCFLFVLRFYGPVNN